MRKLMTLTLAFAAGVFVVQYLLPAGWILPGAALMLAVFFAAIFLPKGPWRVRLLLMAAGLYLSLVWCYIYGDLVQRPMEALADTYVSDTVLEVCDWPEETDYGARVTCRIRREGIRFGKVVCYGQRELLALGPGDQLRGDVYFSSAAQVDDTDITTFTSRGVFLLAYFREEMEAVPGERSLRYLPQLAGKALRERLTELYDGDTAAFLQALLTGDKSSLSDRVYGDLSGAGLLHITAVSGLHCMFLLGLLQVLIGRHRRRLLAAVAVPVLIFYALLAGASPSAVRACIMAIFLLAAPLLGRESDPPTALSAALAVILLDNPFAAASVSLQLSFGAVAGLLWLSPRVYRGLAGEKPGRHRVRCFLAGSLSATAGALVFTIPLTAVYFNQLVLVSPLSNLLCLWAATTAFVLGLMSVLLSMVWMPLGMLLAWPADWVVRYLLAAARGLCALPYHALSFSNSYLKYWLTYAYTLLLACLWERGGRRRRYVVSGVLAAATLALTIRLGAAKYHQGALDIVVQDVGQGESLILTSGGHTAVVDCGSNNSFHQTGEETVELLSVMGVGELDSLVLSHYHADHANGMTALLERFPVKTLYLPDLEDASGIRESLMETAKARGTRVVLVDTQLELPLGEAELTLYPPTETEIEDDANEACISVLCRCGAFDLLTTADMDTAGEKRLLEAWTLPRLEVLLVGHHGSASSTSRELLEQTQPGVGIVSVGDNSYGHPTDEALRRLVQRGAEIYRTDLQGRIHICVY